MNLTEASTKFNWIFETNNEIEGSKPRTFIQDAFITCSFDRFRNYELTINLELANPFDQIDIVFVYHNNTDSSDKRLQMKVVMPDSTMLVQLKQYIKYDECLDVQYVQFSPDVTYELECSECNEDQRRYLDKIFHKRTARIDAELDALLSEKLELGLRTLLSQKRLDLDLYTN